jgi:transposase
VREIASTYHCSTSYITNLVKRYKLPLKSPGEGRRGGNMGHIEISKRELKEMRDDGLTLGEIAEVFGCGVNLISVKIREYKLPLRGGGRRKWTA